MSNSVPSEMICRYCNANLDGGEVYEVLKVHPLYMDRLDGEIRKMAKSYGWTEENKLHFDKRVIIQFDDRDQQQIMICPTCNGIEPFNNDAPKGYFKKDTTAK